MAKFLEEWKKLIKTKKVCGAKVYIFVKDTTREVQSFRDTQRIGSFDKLWPAHPADQNQDNISFT